MHGSKLAYDSMHFLLDVFGVQPNSERGKGAKHQMDKIWLNG